MAAPTPITTADVPSPVSSPIPNGLKPGIVLAYNQWALAEYNSLTAAQKAAYVAPSKTPTQYILDRLADVFKSYQAQSDRAELIAAKVEEKWPLMTQAQRNQIKAIADSIP